MLYCLDLDLIQREPALLHECAEMATPVWSGVVDVFGTTMTPLVPGSITIPPCTPGMLVYFQAKKATTMLAGAPDVDQFSVCMITASVTHEQWPDDIENYAGPGNGTGLYAMVYTFPQVRAASDQIRDTLGLSDVDTQEQVDPQQLRRACTFLSLAMIFRSMAALDRTIYSLTPGSASFIYNEDMRREADWYEQAYEREIRRIQVHIDRDADGTIDEVRLPGTPTLSRE